MSRICFLKHFLDDPFDAIPHGLESIRSDFEQIVAYDMFCADEFDKVAVVVEVDVCSE